MITMSYMISKLANLSFRPTVVVNSNVKFSFCRDIAASNHCPLSKILCNFATVSENEIFIQGALLAGGTGLGDFIN